MRVDVKADNAGEVVETSYLNSEGLGRASGNVLDIGSQRDSKVLNCHFDIGGTGERLGLADD